MKKGLVLGLMLSALPMMAQENAAKKDANEKNVFTVVKEVGRTSIKDQANSGTCWSYSGQGFFEEELLRIGKKGYDLSEMFVVDHSYRDKVILTSSRGVHSMMCFMCLSIMELYLAQL